MPIQLRCEYFDINAAIKKNHFDLNYLKSERQRLRVEKFFNTINREQFIAAGQVFTLIDDDGSKVIFSVAQNILVKKSENGDMLFHVLQSECLYGNDKDAIAQTLITLHIVNQQPIEKKTDNPRVQNIVKFGQFNAKREYKTGKKVPYLHMQEPVYYYGHGKEYAAIKMRFLGNSVNVFDLPIQQKLSQASQLLFGIRYLHKHNAVHRDIKNDNLVTTPLQNGMHNSRLIDFEASTSKKNVKYHHLRGTPGYISPILFTSKRSFKKLRSADIFSAGVTIAMMFLSKPFDSFNFEDALINDREKYMPMLHLYLNRAYQSIQDKLADYPDQANSLIQLIKDMCVINRKEQIKLSDAITELTSIANVIFDRMPVELQAPRFSA